MDISLAGGRESPVEEGSLEDGYLQAAPAVSSDRRTLSGERWVPDAEAVRCDACEAKFGFWRRRVRAQPLPARCVPCLPAARSIRAALDCLIADAGSPEFP